MPRESTGLDISLNSLSDHLKASKNVVIFSGAGISTPSGIADFRTPKTGLWDRYNPMDYASLSAFRRDPRRFQSWLKPLLTAALQALPNPAHKVIARLESDRFIEGVITQNIDGLHRRGGSKNVVEIHGTLDQFYCVECGTRMAISDLLNTLENNEGFIKCPDCNGILRPDIVLFEEQLPETEWRKAVTMAEKSDMFIVTGSSLEVNPAAFLPQIAKQKGSYLVINTLLPTCMDSTADALYRYDVVQFWEGIQRNLYG